MPTPILPNLPLSEQAVLYQKLDMYNRNKQSYKEAGAYLITLPSGNTSFYTLRIYSPLPERQSIFFLCNLAPDISESLRMATTLCFYSTRPLFIVDYNAKHMQTKGDDLISFGKYHGHYLHEILRIDPSYLSWIAFKFQPRIPKQERLVLIAKIYHSVYLDIQQRKHYQTANSNQFLGKPRDKVQNLTLTVLKVRLEDNPYRTRIIGHTPIFYVCQTLILSDAYGRLVILRKTAKTPSYVSGQLPAIEHAFQVGEIIHIVSATIAQTYCYGRKKYTRLIRAVIENG